MKKYWMMSLLLATVSIMVTGCNSCQSENKKQDVVINVGNDYDGVVEGKLNAENVISLQRQTMYNLSKGVEYRWFETTFELLDYIDSENQDGTIAEITSTFQTIIPMEGGCDTWVQYIASNAVKGTMIPQPIHSFFVGDSPLDNAPIKLTFAQALERINQVNAPKPHSRYCVLRKEIAPNDINPQYIFGNSRAQLYVDAVTGTVCTENPAFAGGFGLPLGEWP